MAAIYITSPDCHRSISTGSDKTEVTHYWDRSFERIATLHSDALQAWLCRGIVKRIAAAPREGHQIGFQSGNCMACMEKAGLVIMALAYNTTMFFGDGPTVRNCCEGLVDGCFEAARTP